MIHNNFILKHITEKDARKIWQTTRKVRYELNEKNKKCMMCALQAHLHGLQILSADFLFFFFHLKCVLRVKKKKSYLDQRKQCRRNNSV